MTVQLRRHYQRAVKNMCRFDLLSTISTGVSTLLMRTIKSSTTSLHSLITLSMLTNRRCGPLWPSQSLRMLIDELLECDLLNSMSTFLTGQLMFYSTGIGS